jgi:hypothetical protein
MFGSLGTPQSARVLPPRYGPISRHCNSLKSFESNDCPKADSTIASKIAPAMEVLDKRFKGPPSAERAVYVIYFSCYFLVIFLLTPLEPVDTVTKNTQDSQFSA